MAPIASRSSVPPHIQPPMAQVPRPIVEARIPERPISRVSISCVSISVSGDIAYGLQCFEGASRCLLIGDQRVKEATAQGGQDRLDFRRPSRNTDDSTALRDFSRRQGDQSFVQGVIRHLAVGTNEMGKEFAADTLAEELLPVEIRERMQVVIA